MVSAVLISREVFAFLPISGGRSFGRTLHMLCAYWGFVLLSFHLGIHWNMILGMAGKMCGKLSKMRAGLIRTAGFLIAAYGIYALIRRNIPAYLFYGLNLYFSTLKNRSSFSFWIIWLSWACLCSQGTMREKQFDFYRKVRKGSFEQDSGERK